MESVMTMWAGEGALRLAAGEFDPLGSGAWPLFFWTALVFVLLLVLLTKFAWGPIMKAVGDREDRIKSDLEQAEQARREAEEVRVKHAEEMAAAAAQAKALLDEARDRAADLKLDLERQARSEADDILVKARQQIEADKVQAMQDIRDQVVDLSVEITKQIVDKAVDREDHLRLAEALIPKVRDV